MISNARQASSVARAVPALLVIALVLSACSSTFDVLPEKLGGLPADAPARPTDQPAFPNVYEERPVRELKSLTADEQKKLESELVTLREQQKQLANPPPPPPPPPPAKKAAVPKPAAAPKKEAVKKEPTKAAAPAKKKQNEAVVPEQKGPVAPPKLVN